MCLAWMENTRWQGMGEEMQRAGKILRLVDEQVALAGEVSDHVG